LKISIIGSDYVGSVTGICLAARKHDITLVDNDASKVEQVNNGSAPDIFTCLKNTRPGIGGEIQLTDAIRLLLKDTPVYAYCFKGKRYDTGDKIGYIETIIDFALQSKYLRDPMLKFLRERVDQ
jgi:hypothetical protein